MKKLFAALKRLITGAEKEYHHIVDKFHSAVDELHELAERKSEQASKLAKEIEAKANEKAQALEQQVLASNTAAGIRKMLAGGQ
jgi:Skp family chaperone for outer membrane proteins